MALTTLKKKKEPSLRKQAKLLLKKQTGRMEELSKKDMQHLIVELGTHQIELEMQNEELRRAQSELDASRAKYTHLYDFAPVGYFTLDGKGVILEVNLTGAELLGEKKRLLLNKPLSRFLPKEEELRTFFDHLAETLQKQTKTASDETLRKKDGTVFHARLQSIVHEDEKGKPSYIRTAISDVTAHKLLEKALKQSNAELETLNSELEAFSFTVANDLKTPLRHIEGFSRALIEDYADRLDEKGREYCAHLQSASLRMSQLIDAMYILARTTGGELHLGSVDLSKIAQIAADKLRKQYPGQKVNVVIAEGLQARGDREMLSLVVDNLLDNAWKFTSKHEKAKIEFGMRIAECGMKDCKFEAKSENVYFVRDDGAGFDSRYASRLFQPFHRLHSDDEFPGLGIGLAIANHIIKRHGGRIWAESEREQGATFYFTL